MKKKFRKITIKGLSYGWTLSEHDGLKTVQVWLDKKPLFQFHPTAESVTPSLIATEIHKRYTLKETEWARIV